MVTWNWNSLSKAFTDSWKRATIFKHTFQYTKRLILSDSTWICANSVRKLSRNLRMSTSSSICLRKSEKCWEKAHFSVHITTVFQRICLNLCKFCEKIVKKLAEVDFLIQYICARSKHAEKKQTFECTKRLFLSDSAWICASFVRKLSRKLGMSTSSFNMFAQKRKMLRKTTLFSA